MTRTLTCRTPFLQDLLLALVPNGVRGPAPAPGRKEAQEQDHRPHGPAQTLAQAQPRCPARRRDLTLALVPVLTPARAPARAPGPALALAPDPDRPAQRPAQAASGSVRVLARGPTVQRRAWLWCSAGLRDGRRRRARSRIRVRVRSWSRRWELRLEEAAALGSVQV